MLIGACLDNLDKPPDKAYNQLARMEAKVCKTLWTNGTRHRREVYERLAAVGIQRYLIRVGPSARIDAGTLFKDVLDAVYEARIYVRVEDITIQLMNEPNLWIEGGWSVRDYVQLYADVIGMSQWESIPMPWIAGPSFGVEEGLAWIEQVFSALEPPGLVVNDYHTVTPVTLPTTRWGLGEVGCSALANEVRRAFFKEALVNAKLGGAEFACVFTLGRAGNSHNAWDEGYIIRDEDCDVFKEIAREVV